jgi:predicted ATPase
MKIKTVTLREFKRFSDLTITNLPETARLVVLVGRNGSGKTSLFESFNYWIDLVKGGGHLDPDYHWKVGFQRQEGYYALREKIKINFHGDEIDVGRHNDEAKRLFYFRSAYRHEADFSLSELRRIRRLLDDESRPPTLISAEQRVSDNYKRIIGSAVSEVFAPENETLLAGNIRDKLVGRVRDAMKRVFEDLDLIGVGSPLTDGTFFFQKGSSRNFRYKNLSGGEKAAFDLLLDFVVKTEEFNNTVFCLDEPEMHMHSRLQATLLNELYLQLPDKCQLWIATHSIGMIKRAMELYQANSQEVVFLDFDGKNFDEAVILEPVRVDRQFWKRSFAVAVDDLTDLIAPSEIVFCEGRPETGRRKDKTFDAEIYRRIFRFTHPNTEFVPLGGTSDLEKNTVILADVFKRLFTTMKTWKLVDRDDIAEETIEALISQGTRVLGRRDLESYLWDDEILQKLAESKMQGGELQKILEIKQGLLLDLPNRDLPADDVKSISGLLYVQVKKILGLTQCGNTAEEFCKVTLAPLITPETKTYQELEKAVFGTVT